MTHVPTLPGRRTGEHLEAWVSVALVTGLVVVHLLMALSYSTLPDAVFDAVDGVTGQSLGTLLVSVLPVLPLAAVVLLWARTRFLGGLACAVVLTEGLLGHLRGVVARRLLDGGDAEGAQHLVHWTGVALAALLPATVVLAWGLARRSGRAWLPGVAVAGAAGLLAYSLDLGDRVGTSSPGHRAVVLAAALHVVPALVGGLLAWGLQFRDERR